MREDEPTVTPSTPVKLLLWNSFFLSMLLLFFDGISVLDRFNLLFSV